MKNSEIEWTHHTQNLWWGCNKVIDGGESGRKKSLNKDLGRVPRSQCKENWNSFFFQQLDKDIPTPVDLLVPKDKRNINLKFKNYV